MVLLELAHQIGNEQYKAIVHLSLPMAKARGLLKSG